MWIGPWSTVDVSSNLKGQCVCINLLDTSVFVSVITVLPSWGTVYTSSHLAQFCMCVKTYVQLMCVRDIQSNAIQSMYARFFFVIVG